MKETNTVQSNANEKAQGKRNHIRLLLRGPGTQFWHLLLGSDFIPSCLENHRFDYSINFRRLCTKPLPRDLIIQLTLDDETKPLPRLYFTAANLNTKLSLPR